MAKRLIRLFGFAIHDAPGEAEAECALLQREGVVEAVLSEDVDTIMFGCGRTLRNWSAAEVKRPGNTAVKPPTHVSVYDVAALRQGETGLDREGMVLVALMSGGDYIPEGVPGCGVKVACQAARAGFGRRLCRIKRADETALHEWREDLRRELRTNESKFFRVKHKALTIPEEFPDMDVLRYYTHPVVSQPETVEKVRRELSVRREIDVAGLRAFTAETYDWSFKIGAIKFIRVLGPGLLVQKLMNLSRQELESDDPEIREELESKVVRAISIRRTHASTDATPELRISYIPNDIVGIDLDAEEDEVTSTFGRSGLALNSDDEADDGEDEARSGPKKVFDPFQPDLVWVPETVAKFGVPLTVEDWEGKQRAKKTAPAKSSRKKTSDMPQGALDRYVKTTKPSSTVPAPEKDLDAPFLLSASQPPPSLTSFSRPTRSKRPTTAAGVAAFDQPSSTTRTSKSQIGKAKTSAATPSLDVNPWSIASSQTTPKAPRISKSNMEASKETTETILISSSPVAVQSPPPPTTPIADPLPLDDNSKKTPSLHDPFSSETSPPSPSRTETPDSTSATSSPRKHSRPVGEHTCKPAAKRAQRIRAASPTRRSTRSTRTAQQKAQPSIKGFGRLSKHTALPEDKPPSSRLFDLDDEDDGLEDLTNLGTKKVLEEAVELPLPCLSIEVPNDDSAQTNPSTPKKSNTTATAIIELTSSPPTATLAAAASLSPFNSPAKTSKSKTRIYVPRTSAAGVGFFREIEVSHEEADRLMREDAGRKGRAGGSRMWRESDVSIWDLTGDDWPGVCI